jgi:nicotinamide-nucleotide amidase
VTLKCSGIMPPGAIPRSPKPNLGVGHPADGRVCGADEGYRTSLEAMTPPPTGPITSPEGSAAPDRMDGAELAARLSASGLTLSVAESLTGGLLASSFAQLDGASDYFVGGIVAYSSEVKFELLGVSRGDVVTQRAAEEMATGCARLFGADFALAATGVGGPGPHEGRPPGTVFLAVRHPDGDVTSRKLQLSGGPDAICTATCAEGLRLVDATLARWTGTTTG